jgi:integrase
MARRRGKGDGGIRRRSDGRWEACIELGAGPGQRPRKWIYGPTRAAVAERLRQAQAELDAGMALANERVQVGQFLDRWLADVIRPTRSHETWVGYEVNVRRHIKPAIGRRALAKLSPMDVQALITAKFEGGLAPRTVQYIHATQRAALNTAMRWGLVGRNVAMLVDPVRVDRPPVTPFSPEEVEKLLEAAADHRLGAFYVTAMAIGLRPSEALALTWSDVDLTEGVVHVRRALERRDGQYHFKETKSRTSRRNIPLPKVCALSLRAHRRRQLEERLVAGAEWQDHDLVFSSVFGLPLHRSEVSRQFSLLQEKAGVAHRRLYDCRHTAASMLLAQGVAPRVVMETLGHSSYALTMDTYTHVMPTLMRDAADAMDRALRRPK